MTDSHCNGCGARIVWGVTENGKRIPLDPRPAVYILTDHVMNTPLRNTEPIARIGDAMVSHFITCPHASDFSKGRKKT